MKLDVVLLPGDLRQHHLEDRAVAVFDVLRATTTITAALAAGVSQIRLFPDVLSARQAAAESAEPDRRLLMGEENCLPPEGFDLGNSPGQLRHKEHAGRIAYMCTTNGTRALIAAKGAAVRYAASLVNASAVARALMAAKRDVTLLCAGTGGQVSLEDTLGCGAVIGALERSAANLVFESDAALIARRLFADNRHHLRGVIADGEGGRNVLAAGLTADIDFCSRLDVLNVVGMVEGLEPTVRAAAAR